MEETGVACDDCFVAWCDRNEVPIEREAHAYWDGVASEEFREDDMEEDEFVEEDVPDLCAPPLTSGGWKKPKNID